MIILSPYFLLNRELHSTESVAKNIFVSELVPSILAISLSKNLGWTP